MAGVIFFQTFTAVGMNVKLLPVTGLTLDWRSSDDGVLRVTRTLVLPSDPDFDESQKRATLTALATGSATVTVGVVEAGPTAPRLPMQVDVAPMNVAGTWPDLLAVTRSEQASVQVVDPSTGDTLSAVMTGLHWLDENWGLSWDLIFHEQGDAYRRGGIRVGLRRQF